MSVLKTAQGIEKLQLDSNLNSLSKSAQTAIEEELTVNKKSMKKLQVEDGSTSPPHGGKKRREEDITKFSWHRPGGYTEDVIGFHEEISDFYDYMKPTEEEGRMREYAIESVRSVISKELPNMEMKVFGSYCTQLYLPSSDIDLVLLGECSTVAAHTLHDIKVCLIREGIAKEESIRVLDRAVVPIIKFTHCLVGIKVDISINQSKGLDLVPYIKSFLEEFPTLPKLIFVLKQFLVSRDLNEVWHGGLSSYALISMCISLLQLHADPKARTPQCNLGVLLQEFFELYGLNFNYDTTCIRIKEGGRYIHKEESNLEHGFGLLTIEDPLTEGNDLGRGSYAMARVRDAFQSMYHRLCRRLTKNKGNTAAIEGNVSILDMVVIVPEDMELERLSYMDRWKALSVPSPNARILPTVHTDNNNFHHSPIKQVDDDEEGSVKQACQIRPNLISKCPADGIVQNDAYEATQHNHHSPYGGAVNHKKKQKPYSPLTSLPPHQQENKRNGTDNKRPIECGNGDISENRKELNSRVPSSKMRQQSRNRGSNTVSKNNNCSPPNRKYSTAAANALSKTTTSSSSR